MAHDTYTGVWFYVPNLGASILFAILFSIICSGLIYQVTRGGLRRFFATVLVGVAFEIAGFSSRAAARYKLGQVAFFAVQQSLIVLAPLFIAAGNYVMASRLILASSRSSRWKQRFLCLPIRWITPIFVSCDVFAILIQSSGTSISAGEDWVGPTAKIGSNVLLAGLTVQTVTVALFLALSFRFNGVRLVALGPSKVTKQSRGIRSTLISSIFIELRCIYRLIEHALGYHGYLFTHEWTFYLFEALPMVFAIGVLALWYPPHYVPRLDAGAEDGPSKEMQHQPSNNGSFNLEEALA